MTNTRPIDDLFENEISQHGGFTYDPSFGFLSETDESKKHFGRYVVSVANCHILSSAISRRQIKDMVNHAHANGLMIGGWRDEETGLRHWDYVQCFHTKCGAMANAEKLGEIAIFDSQTMEEIRLK